jgi:hypothetical protein
MSVQTALTRALKITHPIFQAPMAGGGDTPELVAAVFRMPAGWDLWAREVDTAIAGLQR